jgi:subtilase family serine protease
VTPLLLSGIDGRGQSIVILSGSPDPSLSSDLHAFDQAFNLPDPQMATTYLSCTLSKWACQVSSSGSANPAVTVETSIDTEWSHALAPRAHLDVVTVDTSQAQTAEQVHDLPGSRAEAHHRDGSFRR